MIGFHLLIHALLAETIGMSYQGMVIGHIQGTDLLLMNFGCLSHKDVTASLSGPNSEMTDTSWIFNLI